MQAFDSAAAHQIEQAIAWPSRHGKRLQALPMSPVRLLEADWAQGAVYGKRNDHTA